MKHPYYREQRCRVVTSYADNTYDIVSIQDADVTSIKMYLKINASDLKWDFERRLYFFVLGSLSGICKGIQAGHAAIEYARHFGNCSEFKDFAKYDKTFILLNGGTSNDGTVGLYGMEPERGSMEELLDTLSEIAEASKKNVATYRMSFTVQDFVFALFTEPDANRSLTALAFLLDERVWDFKRYPEFETHLTGGVKPSAGSAVASWLQEYAEFVNNGTGMSAKLSDEYNHWVETVMGGEINVRLRNVIRGRRLA